MQQSDFISLAVDETLDVNDVAQLAVYGRYFDGISFQETLLGLLPLTGNTRGQDMYAALLPFLTSTCSIPLTKVISITTDGAPAMVGHRTGLFGLLRQQSPELMNFQCIIHQAALCGRLRLTFQDLMTEMMKLVNYLKSKSSLRHRTLRSFLNELDATYDELLPHNNVRYEQIYCHNGTWCM